MFLLTDTETNGLMDFKRSAEAEGQPRVAEFGALLLDNQLRVMASFQRYVRRDGWSMSPETTEKNGITDEMLDQHGVPIGEVLDFYEHNIKAGFSVIAFNAQFDCKMLRSELARAGRDKLFYETKNACMMRDARPFLKSIGRTIVKYDDSGTIKSNQGGFPRLSDLCILCGVRQEGRHNALDDVHSTHACLLRLIEWGYVPDPRVHESKNLEAIRSAK
jgi:DNA polymerase-3 subunit epsilon